MKTDRVAILSMDVEDFWDLAYMPRQAALNSEKTMLDGLDWFLSFCDSRNVKSTLFCLLTRARDLKRDLRDAVDAGHEIGLHGLTHQLPLTISTAVFREQVDAAKKELEDMLGVEVNGYRAPCFSLDRERLQILIDLGFKYDSSLIDNSHHPLYGSIDLCDFSKISEIVYYRDNFFEFGLPSTEILGRQVPISGGGYLRLLPWYFYKLLFQSYIKENEYMAFYLHPFEFSSSSPPEIDQLGLLNSIRFYHNLTKSRYRLTYLIDYMMSKGWSFAKFCDYREMKIYENFACL